MAIPPFSILSYGYQNPLWCAPNVAVNVSPVPGFSAVSYALTGSLPTGLSFSTSTGTISGIPTTVTPTTTLTITATLTDSSTSSVTMPITVSSEPPQAIVANTASAVGLVNSKLIAQTNFLSSTELVINNNNSIGLYSASLILGPYITYQWAYAYLTSLNYSVVNLAQNQNDYEFTSFFGQPTGFPSPASNIYNQNFEDFVQPTNLAPSRPVRKIGIAWRPFTGYQTLPWQVPPFYGPY